MICQSCGVEQLAEARFCEGCGTPLQSVAASETGSSQPGSRPTGDASTCSFCGYGPDAFGADGFCSSCGQERVDVSRNHVEVCLSPRLAGVSDVGKNHFRNEDALALASASDGEVLVVCDGVSMSQNPDLASAAAASAALGAAGSAAPGQSSNHSHALVAAALQAAREAVHSIPVAATSQSDPPETTILIAVRRGRRVSLGWVGDSRAYVIAPEGARQCTVDHSWLNEVVKARLMALDDALRSPMAHALTRSLGGPETSSEKPSQVECALPIGPSYLVLCSDGLWNYLPDPETLAVLIRGQPVEADALAIARSLVKFALQRGGDDNITVAVLMCENPSETV